MHFLADLVLGALRVLLRGFLGVHFWGWARGGDRVESKDISRAYLLVVAAVIGFCLVLAGVMYVGNLIFHDVKLPYAIVPAKKTPQPIMIVCTPTPTPAPTPDPTPAPTPAWFLDRARQVGETYQPAERVALTKSGAPEPALPEGVWVRVERVEPDGRLYVEARLSSGESLGRGWLARP